MFIVEISHLDEDQLAFFGWVITSETDDFSIYIHVRTGDEQIVSKSGRKYLVVEDVNDARQMSRNGNIVSVPSKNPTSPN